MNNKNKEKEMVNLKKVPFEKLPCSKCEWRYSTHCPKCEWNKDLDKIVY